MCSLSAQLRPPISTFVPKGESEIQTAGRSFFWTGENRSPETLFRKDSSYTFLKRV